MPSCARNMEEMNRNRDTRSVESFGYNDKFQGKPPMGKRGRDLYMPKRNNRDKFDSLPPRFRKIQERKMMQTSNNIQMSKTEDGWDGSTVTFQVRKFFRFEVEHKLTKFLFECLGPYFSSLPISSSKFSATTKHASFLYGGSTKLVPHSSR